MDEGIQPQHATELLTTTPPPQTQIPTAPDTTMESSATGATAAAVPTRRRPCVEPPGINLVVVDSDASMLGDESGDTDSEEAQLFTEMIVKLSAAAAPDPVRKLLLAAKAEELTKTNKAREARESAARFRRSGRSASSPSLCFTIRLTEMNIQHYVENVIRRSVMEGRSPRCL
jgi:hypothetical protein